MSLISESNAERLGKIEETLSTMSNLLTEYNSALNVLTSKISNGVTQEKSSELKYVFPLDTKEEVDNFEKELESPPYRNLVVSTINLNYEFR